MEKKKKKQRLGEKQKKRRLTGGHPPRDSPGCEGLVELDEGLLVVRLPPSQNDVHLDSTTGEKEHPRDRVVVVSGVQIRDTT